MLKRTFLNTDEAIAAFDGDYALLAEAIDLHDLRMQYRFRSVKAEHMDEGDFADSLRRSGEHGLAHWSYFTGRPNSEDPEKDTSHYRLTGWFQLDRDSSLQLFCGRSVPSPSVASFKDGLHFGMFFQLETGALLPEHGRFLVADIERLRGPALQAADCSDIDRPLDKRERTTLLNIIGALAEGARVDLSKPHKAGEAIAAILDAKSVKLSARAIGEHLKAVREAMESRKS